MTATPVNRDAIRMLVMELGYERTSIKTGIKQATLRKWAERGQWWTTEKPTKALVTNVTPSRVLADELAENERETRLSLSRYAKRAAQDSENATLKDAPYVHKAAQVAGLVHKWGDEKPGQQFTLNVLNINSLTLDQEAT